MKQMFAWMLLLVAMMFTFMAVAPAQTIDNSRVSITLNGDRASYTIKDATANAAIGELVDAVRVKDFVKEGNYLYANVYTGDVEANGMSAVWYLVKDGDSYGANFLDDATSDAVKFTSLADAKKELKRAMRAYYAEHKTLDPVGITAR